MFVTDDEVGPGQLFAGTGFPPDVPLEMSLLDDNGNGVTLTEIDFTELRSDVRGAFQLHLFANRENIGSGHLEVAGGGCVARLDFDVKATAFPAAACDRVDELPASGNEASDAYATAVLDDEPLAYWRFEESGGRSVTDSAGGEDGELVVDATLGQPGFIDGSRAVLLFGGKDWVDVPDVELDGDFTVEGWIRFCGETIDNSDALVGQAGEGPDIDFAQWRLRLWTGPELGDVAFTEIPIGREGWQHLAATRRDGVIALYQGGVKVADGEWDGVFPIEAIGSGDVQQVRGSLEGWLDEIAIYDHALSAARIAERAAFGG